MIVSRDVVFHENSRWDWETNSLGEQWITIDDLGVHASEDRNKSSG